MRDKTLLFSTFDVFPSSKGAAIHINHTLQALQKRFTAVHLVCLGSGDMPGYQEEGNIFIHRCLANHPNFLKRTQYFESFLFDVLDTLKDRLQAVHFRDIWSGMPVFEHPVTQKQNVLKIFEVNGLPSIELPYHYPALLRDPALISRFKAMEDFCLENADGIITVSRVNRRYLIQRGIEPGKILTISNTALPIDEGKDEGKDEGEKVNAGDDPIILYAGTLSPWQGLPVLLQAFRSLSNREKLRLYILCSSHKHLQPLKKTIEKMKLSQRVTIEKRLGHGEVYRFYRRAYVSVAPLTRCGRNELQGCCPLKIIESMAVGTPVIASRLPVCAEIIDHQTDGWLVTPGSPRALASALQMLLDHPKLRDGLGEQAKEKINRSFPYETWTTRHYDAYHTFSERRKNESEYRSRAT